VIVFLIRHAYVVGGDHPPEGASRHLTEHGRRAAREIGQRLRWHDCTPTTIWTSPLAQAVMTAELIARALDWDGPIECPLALSPLGDPGEVLAMVDALDPDGVLVMIGHEPGLSAIGRRLCGPGFPSLRPAQAARIDDGVLRWLFACDADAPIAT